MGTHGDLLRRNGARTYGMLSVWDGLVYVDVPMHACICVKCLRNAFSHSGLFEISDCFGSLCSDRKIYKIRKYETPVSDFRAGVFAILFFFNKDIDDCTQKSGNRIYNPTRVP